MKKLLRRLIGYSNLLFAILLVISSLSPNISPEKYWGPSFLGLAYPYILLFNILFLLFWIWRKKKELMISILAILLGWNTLSAYISIHPGAIFQKSLYKNMNRSERAESKTLKFMSYNVRAFDRYRWTDKPGARQEIFDLLRKDDPDIICLQEYYCSNAGESGSDELYDALNQTPNRHIEYAISNPQNCYGIATFSFYPIVGRGRIEMKSSLSLCIFTDIIVDEDTLRIYNMHLQSIRLNHQHYRFIDSLKFRYDNQQMEEIKDISYRLRDAFVKRASQADLVAGHIAESPYAVIICGDFNDTPVSYSYRRIRAGLQDAFVESGWGVGRTYNGKFPSFRIDYILFDDNLEALHFSRKKVRLSDHYPITGYLKIREKHIPGEQIRGWIQK